jgi:peptide methionine sulfoxide reductase MsrB
MSAKDKKNKNKTSPRQKYMEADTERRRSKRYTYNYSANIFCNIFKNEQLFSLTYPDINRYFD